MKMYIVQDLASYNREIVLDNGHRIRFNGHSAIISEEDSYYFNRVDDFQLGKAQEVLSVVLEEQAVESQKNELSHADIDSLDSTKVQKRKYTKHKHRKKSVSEIKPMTTLINVGASVKQ